jgi:hypothetical protein
MGSGDFRIGSDLKVYVFRNIPGIGTTLRGTGGERAKEPKGTGEGERKDGRQMCKMLHIRGPPETSPQR